MKLFLMYFFQLVKQKQGQTCEKINGYLQFKMANGRNLYKIENSIIAIILDAKCRQNMISLCYKATVTISCKLNNITQGHIQDG